ncbi:methyltransferase protein [Puccinia graminis f. sp. tritici]|uniref:Methyltransferase protein n=3 Tax=Puccinia graminis f. sp. tritici TaxID=56615 RepID=A0A5B0M0T8_PUCGR|nr:methyltransferase protein [Puccinia graminis f. sp. tritici]
MATAGDHNSVRGNNKNSPMNEPQEYHWTQSAFNSQRTPMILKLTQTELDALLTTYQIKDNINNHLNNHSLSLNPYGPPPTSSQSSPLNSLIKTSLNNLGEYDALALPLTNPSWRARWDSLCVDQSHSNPQPPSASQPPDNSQDAEFWRRAGYFLSSELNFHNTIEVAKCICFASEWLELDSPVEGIRFDCELAMKQEVSYATYLSASHLILPRIRHRRFISDYGRAICSILTGLSSSVVLSIVVPILDTDEKTFMAWEDWHSLRKLCGYHPRLNITLEIPHMGAAIDVPALINRWTAEPIGFLLIPATSFISNAKHYPVLSKSCQTFVKAMLKYKPSVILSQTSEGKHSSGGSLAYAQYIRFLEKRAAAIVCDPIENFAAGYLDYLQAPLQPLADNLDSVVYEGFEKDPVKYSKYEEAIFRALCDRPADATQVLAVCGAGRGPLVEAALRAARRADRVITITAIEKNPNSYLTLQERLRTEWDPEVVQVWFGDMRDYQPTDPIDIIISELLGSFGDNELSPECLDGVIRWLASDGISIPSGYCSFVAPLASNKIHSRVLELGKFETPYVVMIHAAEIISAQGGPDGEMGKVQETWSFAHPRTDLVFSHDTGVPITNFHNARSSHLTFHIPQPSVCHGLAAYFRATLYGNVTIETHPESRMSREMLSWFPMFFPLKEPIYCPKNSELDVHLWRLTDQVGRKVWYEWSVEAYTIPAKRALKGRRQAGKMKPSGSPAAGSSSGSASKRIKVPENTDPCLLTGEMGDSNPIETAAEDETMDEDKDHLDDDFDLCLDLHFDSRVKIATSALHNVLGRESSVKW